MNEIVSSIDSAESEEHHSGYERFRYFTGFYFDPKPFESTKLYECLGIKPYKKYLPTSGDWVRRHIWRAPPWARPNVNSLHTLDFFTRASEVFHLGYSVYPIKNIVESLLAQTVPGVG